MENGITVRELIDQLRKYGGARRVVSIYNGELVGIHYLDSWRGAYSELSLVPTRNMARALSADRLARELGDAIGGTITGHKGGTYTVKEDTNVCLADYSECPGNHTVCGVIESGDCLALQLGPGEFDDGEW